MMNWRLEAESKRDIFLDKLMEFLKIPSVLDESSATEGAPFGKSINDALQFMLDLGRADGFQVKNFSGYAGHIEYGSGDEIVGVLSHIDVVPATEGWTTPPFSPAIRNGKLYARGATDDKGPTMAAYFAMKIIKELELPVNKRIRLIMGTDEETHWRCMDHYLSHEKMPTIGFTPDAEFPIITAEKGFLDVQFAKDGKTKSDEASEWILDSFQSGKRVNMVPEYATAIISGSGDVFELKEAYQAFLMTHRLEGFAEEADEHVKLVLHGRAHHGSEPEKGLSAALELARFLIDLPLDRQGHQYIQMIHECFLDSIFGEKLDMVTEDDIVGKLTVNVGVYRYERDGEQFLRVNIRYPIHADGEQLTEQLTGKLAAYGFKPLQTDNKPGHSFDNDHPLVKTLAKVYEEQTGLPSRSLAVAGATYARALKNCVAYGPIFPGKVQTAHQTDEYIDVDDLISAIGIYAQAIYELAK